MKKEGENIDVRLETDTKKRQSPYLRSEHEFG